MKALFFQVKSSQQKIDRIVETATHHFLKGERLVFIVEEDRSLQFVDQLLWSYPKESFLPHCINPNKISPLESKKPEKDPSPPGSPAPLTAIHSECSERIIISKEKTNHIPAKALFNLCLTPLMIEHPLIYDFEDFSTPNKQMLSQIRFNAYKLAHFEIESLP